MKEIENKKTGIESATVKSKEVKDTLDSLTKEIKEKLLWGEEDYQIKHYANLQKKYEKLKDSLEQGIATEQDVESWLWNLINTLLKDRLKFTKEIIKPIKSIFPLFRKLQDAGVEGRVQEMLPLLDRELRISKEIIPLHNEFIKWSNEKIFIFDNIKVFLEFNAELFIHSKQFQNMQNLQYAFTLYAFFIDDMMNCHKILKRFVDAVYNYSYNLKNVGFFLDDEIKALCELGYSNRSLQNTLEQYNFFSRNRIVNKDNGILQDTTDKIFEKIKNLEQLSESIKNTAQDTNQTLHAATDKRYKSVKDQSTILGVEKTKMNAIRRQNPELKAENGATIFQLREALSNYKPEQRSTSKAKK